MVSMHYVSYNPLIATFQLSSAAYLNMGRPQNGVLGNSLIDNSNLFVGEDPGKYSTVMIDHDKKVSKLTYDYNSHPSFNFQPFDYDDSCPSFISLSYYFGLVLFKPV